MINRWLADTKNMTQYLKGEWTADVNFAEEQNFYKNKILHIEQWVSESSNEAFAMSITYNSCIYIHSIISHLSFSKLSLIW